MTWLQEEILKIRGDQIYNKTHPEYKRNYMKQIITKEFQLAANAAITGTDGKRKTKRRNNT